MKFRWYRQPILVTKPRYTRLLGDIYVVAMLSLTKNWGIALLRRIKEGGDKDRQD